MVSINAALLPAGADSIMDHFRISNVYVHNLDGPSTWQRMHYGGVNFQVFGDRSYKEYGTGGYYFKDVRIVDNTFVNVELHAVQFAFNWFGDRTPDAGQYDENGKWHEGWEQLWVRTRDLYSRDVYIGHNYAESIGQGAFQFANAKNMTAEYNEVNGFLERYGSVSVALYLWAGADSVMQYNEVYGGVDAVVPPERRPAPSGVLEQRLLRGERHPLQPGTGRPGGATRGSEVRGRPGEVRDRRGGGSGPEGGGALQAA